MTLLAPAASRAADTLRDRGIAIRLLSGPLRPDGTWQAGLSLQLDQGWMTYWRNPGEAGVAPRFDWTGSRNLARATVRWPAPRRFDEAGSATIGYQGAVVLPLVVTPADTRQPVELHLAFAYGVCRELCVPGEARLDRVLDPARPSAAAPEIAAAEAAVPRVVPVGDPGPLAVTAVRLEGDGKPRVLIETRAPVGAELFVETPPDWYLGLPTRIAAGAGTQTFALPLDGLPKGVSPLGASLTLTLVAGREAVETSVTVP